MNIRIFVSRKELDNLERKRIIELELLSNVISRQTADLQSDQRFKLSYSTNLPICKARIDGQCMIVISL